MFARDVCVCHVVGGVVCVFLRRCMNSLTIVPDSIGWKLEKLGGQKSKGPAKAVNLNWCGTNPTLFLFRGVILHLVRRRVL